MVLSANHPTKMNPEGNDQTFNNVTIINHLVLQPGCSLLSQPGSVLTSGSTVNTLNATGALTPAMVLGGILTSTTAAPVAATFSTGSAFVTALTTLGVPLFVGLTLLFRVINTGGNSFVLTAPDASITITGNATIATNTSRAVSMVWVGGNTWNVYC